MNYASAPVDSNPDFYCSCGHVEVDHVGYDEVFKLAQRRAEGDRHLGGCTACLRCNDFPTRQRISCGHRRPRRWKWQTEDGGNGEVCDDCLRVVVLAWSDLSSLVRVSP